MGGSLWTDARPAPTPEGPAHPLLPTPSVCRDRKWSCTDHVCDASCSALGLAHYLTFDGLKYLFPGECQYVLVQVRAGHEGALRPGGAPGPDSAVLSRKWLWGVVSPEWFSSRPPPPNSGDLSSSSSSGHRCKGGTGVLIHWLVAEWGRYQS